ncbi:MAG: hypothetical protein J5685_07490 [Clostridiales bacterium]|nr:hypothetical protein [Clostridiales bacterium]
MNFMLLMLNTRIDRLSKLIAFMNKQNNQDNGSTVRIRNMNGYTRYVITDPNDHNKEIYIGEKDLGLVRSVAQRGYNQKVISVAEKELSFLKRVVMRYPTKPEDVYRQLDDARKALVEPVVLDDELYAQKWLEKPYVGRVIEKDVITFPTVNGERVISKSEKIIADSLYRLGIPYKYDCPLNLTGEDGRTQTKYPDFTTLNVKRRKEYYVEHLGMMDDPGYIERNLKKIELYERNGIYPGDNLILIHETSLRPLDVEIMERMLARFLLE